MSNKKSLSEKIAAFVFGAPKPAPPAKPASDRPQPQELERKLDHILARLEALTPSPPNPNGREAPSPLPGSTTAAAALPLDDLADLAEQVRKLARTQFKSNTLQESQLTQQQKTLEQLQQSVTRQDELLVGLAAQRDQAIEAARLDWLKRMLPVLDGLDAAFDAGRRQVLGLPMPPETRRAVVAWLDGVRLARLRLLDLLAAQQITPIPTIGHPFDPHRHVAVATQTTARVPDGTIIAEDRRGYAGPKNMLRFAEVVVARANRPDTQTNQEKRNL